jgi:hypothetical protein
VPEPVPACRHSITRGEVVNDEQKARDDDPSAARGASAPELAADALDSARVAGHQPWPSRSDVQRTDSAKHDVPRRSCPCPWVHDDEPELLADDGADTGDPF